MNNRDTILKNYVDIKKKIQDFSEGRHVDIVLATKYVDIDTIKWAQENFDFLAAGENKVQEFSLKYTPEINWHFIGTLQTNKVKKIIGKVELIHSLNRFELADEIDRVALILNTKQKVLIEVNVGEEETKTGLFINKVIPFIEKVKNNYHNIEIVGLMGMLPKDISQVKQEYYFKKLRDLREQIYGMDNNINILSCGMSSDYLNAIKFAKSNMVRIGQLVFGQRESKDVR